MSTGASPGAANHARDARHETVQPGFQDRTRYAARGQRDLKYAHASARPHDAVKLGKCGGQITDVAQCIAHAEEVRVGVCNRDGFGAAGQETHAGGHLGMRRACRGSGLRR